MSRRRKLSAILAAVAVAAAWAFTFRTEAADAASVPLFMTQHAPVGAWSSFTFGLPGEGVGIENEIPAVQNLGDLIVADSPPWDPGRDV